MGSVWLGFLLGGFNKKCTESTVSDILEEVGIRVTHIRVNNCNPKRRPAWAQLNDSLDRASVEYPSFLRVLY